MVKKFTIPFASQGDANDIPDALQVDGKVSFTQGFGYDYERPYDDPQAKDIAREDMNGLFKAITSAVGELQTLGASEWSNAISYPKGAIVYYEKDLYISQVDDNQNTPPQNWVSITSIANDSLKKVANLSDLTNKATARSNLGLGSSATLNKTDILGTSSNLVATQKLVNDTKINLDNSVRSVDAKADGAQSRADSAYNLANNSVQKNQITSELGDSTDLVASQALVNDVNNKIEYALVDFGIISKGERLVKSNPFDTDDIITLVEVFYDGRWGRTGFAYGSGSNGHGVDGGVYGRELVVTAGGASLIARPVLAGGVHPVKENVTESLPARMHVWRINK